MDPEPIYTADNLRSPAYQLRYTWTGWASDDRFPPEPDTAFLNELADAWERDGIRLLEYNWAPRCIQMTTSVTPEVAPVWYTGRMKGRLQHALRSRGTPVEFSRKLAFGTVGAASRQEVEHYIAGQVEDASLADPRFEDLLENLGVVDEMVDLSEPVESRSGQYHYNLHLVLVVRDRCRVVEPPRLQTLRAQCVRIAEAKGHRLSVLSVMPDHLHAALGGNIEQAPEAIGLAYMNNLAYALGQEALWQPSFYVGTFGEYDMDAVRTEWGRDDG